jgi:hypothetical protein
MMMKFKLGLKLNRANWAFMPRDFMMIESISMMLYSISIINVCLAVATPEPLVLSSTVGAVSRFLIECL